MAVTTYVAVIIRDVSHHHISQPAADGHFVGRQLPEHNTIAEYVRLRTANEFGSTGDSCRGCPLCCAQRSPALTTGFACCIP